jgi:hypothetical protein
MDIFVERTGHSGWPIGKVAAVVGVVATGGAEGRVALGVVQIHAGVAVGGQGQFAIRALERVGGEGAIAPRASSHSGCMRTGEKLFDSLPSLPISIAKGERH